MKGCNAIVRDEASRAGCGIADFSTSTIFIDHVTLNDDRNHPNAHGYHKITDIWGAALQTLQKK